MSETAAIPPEEVLAWLAARFVIDPDHGSMVWVVPPKNHPRMLGREAGSLRPNRAGKVYVHIKKDRRVFKRGWLIFLWVHGRWPTACLDHIDGNSTNDRISNLRDATVTENAWNHKRRARRIPLPMGVRRLRAGRFEARIGFNKKQLHLGSFETPEEAHRVYVAKRRELYGQFA